MAVYRATLHQLDRALDQLDRGLASRGYDADDTLFVFVADHGEGLDTPPHHGPGHGKKMYPTTVQIPWILRGRDVPEGQVLEGLASGVDVLPTVLGLLGLQDAPGGAGENLAPWVTGARKGVLPRKRAHAASMFHVANVASIWTREHQCQAWFEGDRDQAVDGCFDRVADPTFANPLPMTPKLEALRTDLKTWRSRQMTRGKQFEVTEADVDDEQASQLELLGYLDGEDD
jgi:arylsulfatase A-like enzyme